MSGAAYSRFRIVLLVNLLIAGVLFLSGCKEKKEEKAGIPQLKVLAIRGTNVPVFLEMVGQSVGIPTVEITARVEGYLKGWSFQEGSVVKAGQRLFTIEQDKYINNVSNSEADLASKTAAWEKAKLDVARLKPLLNTRAISQNDFDVAVTTEKQSAAGVESAKASLADSKLNLSYTTITSPITGSIGKVQVNPGNLVGHGTSTLLTTISAIDPIYVDFQITEPDYLKIRRYIIEKKLAMTDLAKSIKIFLTLSDLQEYKEPGSIDFIDRAVNPQTGTIAMRAVFKNPDGLIKPGSFVNVNMVLMERENTVVIPQSAMIEIQGKYFVFLVGDQDKVSRTPVMPGRNIQNNVVINGGLKPGDRILLEGFQKFQEGMVVKPIIVK
jgi:membrane fusion protein, multidrug efflux system